MRQALTLPADHERRSFKARGSRSDGSSTNGPCCLRVRGLDRVRLYVDLTMLATLASTLAASTAAPLAA